MKFIPIKNLTSKELVQYGIIGVTIGAVPNIVTVPILVEVLIGAISLLGWICLIWGIIKFFKERKK